MAGSDGTQSGSNAETVSHRRAAETERVPASTGLPTLVPVRFHPATPSIRPRLPRRSGARRLAGRSLAVFLCLAGSITAQDAPGKVLSSHKISATAGGFSGVLDVGDRFGVDVTRIGDLDGNGVADLGVGSHRDSDGGMDRGSIWILFMEADGTVGSQAKISATVGGWTNDLDDGDRFGNSITFALVLLLSHCLPQS